ncbi:MAG: hypothetical protein R2762_11780 [Bryobacteraceae bacterium]
MVKKTLIVLFGAGSLLCAQQVTRYTGNRAFVPSALEANRLHPLPQNSSPDPDSDNPRRNPYPGWIGNAKNVIQPGLSARAASIGREPLAAAPNVQAPVGLNVPGIGLNNGHTPGFNPPDTVGAIGATQFVQAVNVSYAVFNKATGAMIGVPININALFQGLPATDICRTTNSGDPIVNYDRFGGRWVISQFALDFGTPSFSQCFAVSTTSDATGAFNVYSFNFGNDDFIDYPKVGVWPSQSAYTATFNTFNGAGNAYKYGKFCGFERTAMLAGNAAAAVCFNDVNAFGWLPADADSNTPANSPTLFVGPQAFFITENIIKMYQVLWDFVTPANTVITVPPNLTIQTISHKCGGFSRTRCVPQPNGNLLEAVSFRMMHRAPYRRIGSADTLLVNMSVEGGVWWGELRNVFAGTPTVFQQNIFGPDATDRWMASIASDKRGNILLGYSASNATTVHPSIRYTGRMRSEPLGQMENEATILNGAFSKTGSGRWGDYSAMTLDPVDDCTFWFTTMHFTGAGPFDWSTRLSSHKFPSCR